MQREKLQRFAKKTSEELISIFAKQKNEGYWSEVPNTITNTKYSQIQNKKFPIGPKLKEFGGNENQIIGTIECLVFMKKFLLTEFKTWEFVYDKKIEMTENCKFRS